MTVTGSLLRLALGRLPLRVLGGRPPVLQHRVAATRVIEAEEVALRILLAAVVVGADLGDLAVPKLEPLRPSIQPLLARPRVPPGHRPLDDGLVSLLDAVLDEPLSVDRSDAELGVLADALGSLVRPEPRVVVNGVVGEVARDELGVTRVQRFVVGADVVETAHPTTFISGLSIW